MKDCCQDQDNLAAPEQLSDDLAVRVCEVCGSKHYLLTLDTGDLVGEGAEV